MGALLLWMWGRFDLKPWLFGAIALLLVTADLFVTGIDYNPTFDPRLIFPETASLRALKELLAKEEQPSRVVNVDSGDILPGMLPELFGVPTVSGYTSFVPERYAEYVNLTGDRIHTHPNQIYFSDCCDPLLSALNVRYVYAASDTPPSTSQAINLVDRLGQARVESTAGVAEERWSIGGVERQVLYQHPPARLSYELKLRRPVTLTTAIAVNPLAWDKAGDGVQFEAYVAPDGADSETLVFSRYIDPKHNAEERGWLPVEIGLDHYTGKNVTLDLVTRPGPMNDISFDWAGWAEPRLDNYYKSTLQLVYDGPNKIYENKAALPRAWVVHRATQVPAGDVSAVRKRLGAVDFDPAVEAVVEGRLVASGPPADRKVKSRSST
jgi:hypothetical protein